jgi:hypothetical protein
MPWRRELQVVLSPPAIEETIAMGREIESHQDSKSLPKLVPPSQRNFNSLIRGDMNLSSQSRVDVMIIISVIFANFRRKKMAFLLKNQCYDQKFA